MYIVVSGSGANPEIIDRVKKAKKAGCKVMIIIANMSSPLLKLSDHYVVVKADSKNTSSKSSIQPMGSLFEQMSFLYMEGLVLQLKAQLHQTEKDMEKRHANIE